MGFRRIQGPKSIMIKMSKKSDFGTKKDIKVFDK